MAFGVEDEMCGQDVCYAVGFVEGEGSHEVHVV